MLSRVTGSTRCLKSCAAEVAWGRSAQCVGSSNRTPPTVRLPGGHGLEKQLEILLGGAISSAEHEFPGETEVVSLIVGQRSLDDSWCSCPCFRRRTGFLFGKIMLLLFKDYEVERKEERYCDRRHNSFDVIPEEIVNLLGKLAPGFHNYFLSSQRSHRTREKKCQAGSSVRFRISTVLLRI